MRAAAADATGANYNWGGFVDNQAGTNGARSGSGQTAWPIEVAQGAGASNSDLSVTLHVHIPEDADETQMSLRLATRASTPSYAWTSLAGTYNATTSFDGFTLIPGSGTITGVVRVYGIKDS